MRVGTDRDPTKTGGENSWRLVKPDPNWRQDGLGLDVGSRAIKGMLRWRHRIAGTSKSAHTDEYAVARPKHKNGINESAEILQDHWIDFGRQDELEANETFQARLTFAMSFRSPS
eukprot:SAG31_NODE_1366_length_8621_cov_4.579911_3_plen_115_part_00